jgi:hypothetical protein
MLERYQLIRGLRRAKPLANTSVGRNQLALSDRERRPNPWWPHHPCSNKRPPWPRLRLPPLHHGGVGYEVPKLANGDLWCGVLLPGELPPRRYQLEIKG